MSLVSLECNYIVERVRSIAFQVGAFLGDDSAYNREKQAQQVVDILSQTGLQDISEPILQSILYGQNDTVTIQSTQFFEILRFARQYFTQQVLDAIQREAERPRASYLVLKRRILDVEATIENGIRRVDFIVDKERYPIRLSYRVGTQDFLLEEWLKWFDGDLTAILPTGDFKETLKMQMRGRALCFLKYFRKYRENPTDTTAQSAQSQTSQHQTSQHQRVQVQHDRPIYWTYNRVHTVREGLIDQFHADLDKGYLSTYQPHLWKRETFDNIRTFLRREGHPEKIFCTVGRKTFVLDSALSERDIFISIQSGKSERIQGILNVDGLSLRTTEHFVPIQQLLKRLDANPLSELARLGRESQHCTVCNRKLDSEHSLAVGMGPVCASRIRPKMVQQSLF